MQTDATYLRKSDYWFTAHISQTDKIRAHISQVTRVADYQTRKLLGPSL